MPRKASARRRISVDAAGSAAPAGRRPRRPDHLVRRGRRGRGDGRRSGARVRRGSRLPASGPAPRRVAPAVRAATARRRPLPAQPPCRISRWRISDYRPSDYRIWRPYPAGLSAQHQSAFGVGIGSWHRSLHRSCVRLGFATGLRLAAAWPASPPASRRARGSPPCRRDPAPAAAIPARRRPQRRQAAPPARHMPPEPVSAKPCRQTLAGGRRPVTPDSNHARPVRAPHGFDGRARKRIQGSWERRGFHDISHSSPRLFRDHMT